MLFNSSCEDYFCILKRALFGVKLSTCEDIKLELCIPLFFNILYTSKLFSNDFIH